MTTTSTTTSQKHAELKQLAKTVKDSIFDMLSLAAAIIDDHEYVDTKFGSEAKLIEHMEATEFSHFGGVPKLAAMIRAYRHSPSRATWKKNAFNVQVMIDLSDPPAERGDTKRTNWKARCAELEEQVAKLTAEVDRLVGERARLEKNFDSVVA